MANFNPNSIKDLRGKLGLTQKKLGDSLGVTQMTVYRWENVKCPPGAKHLAKLHDMAESNGMNVSFFGEIGQTIGGQGEVSNHLKAQFGKIAELLQVLENSNPEIGKKISASIGNSISKEVVNLINSLMKKNATSEDARRHESNINKMIQGIAGILPEPEYPCDRQPRVISGKEKLVDIIKGLDEVKISNMSITAKIKCPEDDSEIILELSRPKPLNDDNNMSEPAKDDIADKS